MIVKIEIPENTRCLLKLGEKVKFGTPFLEKKINQHLDIFISKELGIEAKKIFQFLKKLVGDKVKKDEIIALKKDFFGEKILLSPADGIIKEIDHQLGKLVLTIEEKEKKLSYTFFKGDVISLNKNYFELEIGRGADFPIKETKTNFGGENFYLDEEKNYQLTADDIAKKIIVCRSISGLIQSKIEALGAIGIITITKPFNSITILVAQLKNSTDFEKIIAKKYSYCLVNKQTSKIYFY